MLLLFFFFIKMLPYGNWDLVVVHEDVNVFDAMWETCHMVNIGHKLVWCNLKSLNLLPEDFWYLHPKVLIINFCKSQERKRRKKNKKINKKKRRRRTVLWPNINYCKIALYSILWVCHIAVHITFKNSWFVILPNLKSDSIFKMLQNDLY